MNNQEEITEIKEDKNELIINELKKEEIKIKKVYVDIKGAIVNPGVYEIEENKKVIDQTCTIMIQKLNLLFTRNPLISKGI